MRAADAGWSTSYRTTVHTACKRMASWSASGNLDSAMLFPVSLRGVYPGTSNPESVSSWVAISLLTSTYFCSRSWISWRFAPVSGGRSPAIIQYFRDVGSSHSPQRALAALVSAWLPGPATATGAAPPGSSPGPATPAIGPPGSSAMATGAPC